MIAARSGKRSGTRRLESATDPAELRVVSSQAHDYFVSRRSQSAARPPRRSIDRGPATQFVDDRLDSAEGLVAFPCKILVGTPRLGRTTGCVVAPVHRLDASPRMRARSVMPEQPPTGNDPPILRQC